MDKQSGHSKTMILGILVLVAILYAVAGFSMKATDQPEFCGSCHVMYEAVRTQQNSMHANLDCNECHTPENLTEQMPFKTWTGLKDMYQNTFGDIQDVIHASDKTKKVVNENCESCHTMTALNVDSLEAKQYCADCHRQVPHFQKSPIAQRRVADD